ncbi:hypothetical protein LJB97_01315, partial [Parabacteroides sp. OttesenSCG-928-O15]|nr:hypothetical protein [Parabacteroides sp. OttesenSCG-928-O15]
MSIIYFSVPNYKKIEQWLIQYFNYDHMMTYTDVLKNEKVYYWLKYPESDHEEYGEAFRFLLVDPPPKTLPTEMEEFIDADGRKRYINNRTEPVGYTEQWETILDISEYIMLEFGEYEENSIIDIINEYLDPEAPEKEEDYQFFYTLVFMAAMYHKYKETY